MQSPTTKALIGLLSVGAIVALFLVLGGEDDAATPQAPTTEAPSRPEKQAKQTKPEAPKATVAEIVVADGAPVGGVAEIKVAKNDKVVITVESDTADEVHIHGYDLVQDVAPGRAVRFAFRAEIDGIFEIELEAAGLEIAQLRVT